MTTKETASDAAIEPITESMCSGCRNDFYNGHNDLGVKKCWSFDTATRVKKILIHIDAMPPYRNAKPEEMPSCYSKQRFVAVTPDALTSDGYWTR